VIYSIFCKSRCMIHQSQDAEASIHHTHSLHMLQTTWQSY
jgi:hypothetical protein